MMMLNYYEFKSGLYHLKNQFPDVEVVPVWISNLKRVMPKGALVPLPLLSTVIFGQPLIHDEKQKVRQTFYIMPKLNC